MMTSTSYKKHEDDCWSDADEEMLAQIDVDFLSDSALSDEPSASTKFSLECDRILEKEGTPLQRYNQKYLIVSDLASQFWCEQKFLYDLSLEVYLARVPAEVEVNVEEDLATKAAKGKGSDIHLARELEIQIPVEIPVETKEDKWAVKFLNLYTAVHGFYHGCHIAREVPIFGCPYYNGVFVYGIIDELCYDPSTHSLTISELKTRRSSHPPKKSHQEKDKYQVGLYRQLFDEMVLNKVTKAMVKEHLGLDLIKHLSKGVTSHIQKMKDFPDMNEMVMDLDHILDVLFNLIQSFTRITSGRVEYVHQETKLPIAFVELDRDESEIQQTFEALIRWWKGDRGTRGVDIEDCWKCNFCPFSSWCEWREVMAQKTSKPWKRKTNGTQSMTTQNSL